MQGLCMLVFRVCRLLAASTRAWANADEACIVPMQASSAACCHSHPPRLFLPAPTTSSNST
jgi:hypothetical protein